MYIDVYILLVSVTSDMYRPVCANTACFSRVITCYKFNKNLNKNR